MKTKHFGILGFILALVLTFTAVTSTATVALAAEDATVQPRISVVYPVSGSSSGYFTGFYSSNNPRYGNIPAGTYYINYSYESGGSAGMIIIKSTSGSERIDIEIAGDGDDRSTGTFDLDGGTYTIQIQASTSNANYEKSYGYDLILYKEDNEN